MENDDVANKVSDLCREFGELLIFKHGFPPEAVMNGALALAVTLYLSHAKDDQRAAAGYLRQFADQLDADAAARAPSAVN